MEIILNKSRCTSLTGSVSSSMRAWYIKKRNGRFFSVCRGNERYRSITLPDFYIYMANLQAAGFIKEIILNKQEKQILSYE